MPEGNQELEFQTKLILALETQGVEDAVAAFNKIVQAEQMAGNSIKDLIKKYGGVVIAVDEVSKAYKAKGDVAKKVLDSEGKKVDKHINKLRSWSKGLNEVGGGIKKLVFPSSFGSALKTVDNYNKTMLSLSASVNRLGIGLSGLEGSLGRIGRETSLTRQETNKLFDDFQSGMRSISIGEFESTMKRIRSIVGSSAQAIGKMQSSLADLSQSFPSLSMALNQLSDSEADVTAAEKDALKLRVRNLYLIGQISDAQYKQISSYISGNQQIGRIDSERQKAMDAQTKAMNEFKRQMESVSMVVGSSLMPFMTKVAKLFEKWNVGSRSLKKDLLAIAGIWATFKIGKGLINLGVNKLMGGKKGGIGGRAGGVLSSITGAGATPVRVVNFNEMNRKSGLSSTINRKARKAIPAGRLGKVGKFLGKGKPGGMLGTAGIYAGSAALVYGGKKGSDALRRKAADLRSEGKGGKAYMAEVGANLSTIGSQAGAGLAIGGRHGGLIGAAIGGAIGLITGSITAGYDTLSGKAEKEAKQARKEKGQFKREFEKEESAANKEAERQKEVEAAVKASTKQAGKTGIGGVYGQALTSEAKAQTAYDKAVEAGGYKGKRKELVTQEGTLKEAKSKYDKESAKMTDAQRSGATEYLKKLQDQYDATKKKLETEEKEDSALQNSLATLDKTSAVVEKLTMLGEKQKKIAEDIGSLRNAQVGYLDAVIQKMALMNNINQGKINDEVEESIKLRKAEAIAYAEVIKILESDISLPQKKEEMKKIKEKAPTVYKGLEEAGFIGEDQLKSAEALAHAKKNIASVDKDISDINLSVLSVYDLQIQKTGLLSTQASKMVQLADNYALGVGASAEMRVKQYQADEQAIRVLGDQLSAAKAQASAADATEAQKTRVLEIENQILDKQMAQAQGVRALRDGWVSALSAQNTAMGGFTDIVMTGQKGLAQMQRLDGSERGETTGAIARRDKSGKVVENVGFDVSERFDYRQGAGPGMASVRGGGKVGGRGRYQEAYGGKANQMNLRNLETRDVEGIRRDLRKAGQKAASGGGALGAGNAIALAAEVARRSQRGGDIMPGRYVNPDYKSSGYGPTSAPVSSPVGGGISKVIISSINIRSDVKVAGMQDVIRNIQDSVGNSAERVISEVIGSTVSSAGFPA